MTWTKNTVNIFRFVIGNLIEESVIQIQECEANIIKKTFLGINGTSDNASTVQCLEDIRVIFNIPQRIKPTTQTSMRSFNQVLIINDRWILVNTAINCDFARSGQNLDSACSFADLFLLFYNINPH